MKLNGMLSALVTPFHDDDQVIDEAALRALVDRTIEAGADGLVPCGGTGEFFALSHDERRLVVEVVADQAAGRVPVIPQTGATTTSEAIRLSRHAEGLGAAAVMLAIPYYEPIGFAEAQEYYAAVASTIDLPIIVYNYPPSNGLQMTPAFVARLANEIENVQYVKDSSGDLGQLAEYVLHYDGDVTVFNGIDSLVGPALLLGVRGFIMGVLNVVAPAFVPMNKAAVNGDDALVVTMWRSLYPLLHFFETNPFVPSVKAACKLLGYPVGAARAPTPPLAPDRWEELDVLISGCEMVREPIAS
jgi:4-hydroxy-tetrahydrodipicolinate synthase